MEEDKSDDEALRRMQVHSFGTGAVGPRQVMPESMGSKWRVVWHVGQCDWP